MRSSLSSLTLLLSVGGVTPYAALLMLVGCATGISQPPLTPRPTQIADLAAEMAATNLTPSQYVNYGMTLVSENCAGWFGAQVAGAEQISTAQTILSLAGMGAGAAGEPIASAVVSGGSAALGALQTGKLAGKVPAAVYTVVKRELQAYREAMPKPTTSDEAVALVEEGAQYCQAPSITGAMMAAMMTAPVSVSGQSMTVFGQPLSHVTPPVVTVGSTFTSVLDHR